MTVGSWDTFERLKTRGLDARRAGNHPAARVYLLQAARSMLELSRSESASPELAEARRRMAERLLELARDQQPVGSSKRAPKRERTSDAGDGAVDAETWRVIERPAMSFDDIAGLDDVKEQLRLRLVYPVRHPELAERFDIRGGGGMLLYGPPGTGKTMLARATAGEIDAAFFRVSAAEVLSKWVGEAEQNVARLFAAAAAQPRSIIFIDEIESLLPARRDDGGSGVMQRVVPQFLQALDGFQKKGSDPFFLAATNVPWQLDPAVLRPGRFDEKIYVPLPDLPARVRLLELYLLHRPLADDIDLPSVAARLDSYSGADIRHICDKSATIPFMQSIASSSEDEPVITMAMIEQVIATTPPSVPKEMVRRFEQWK